MGMVDPISISAAARDLGLSPARVRALAAGGGLAAAKLGDRWFVERAAVERRRRAKPAAGRPFSPRNAWALLSLASGEDVVEVDSSVRSRLRRALAIDGLERLAPRLMRRAEALSFNAHPGEIAHVLKDPGFVRSGISAPGELGLVSGREADGYLLEGESGDFIARHALEPAGIEGNLRLRLAPEEAAHFLKGRGVAPTAAIALDLAEEPDPRSARAGLEALRGNDLERRKRGASLVTGD